MLKKIADIPYRIRLIVEILLVIAIIGAYYYFQYEKLTVEIEDLNKSYDSKIVELNKLKGYQASYDLFKKQLAMVEEQFKSVLEVLPDEKSYYMLYDEILEIAEKSNISVTNFQPAGEQKTKDGFYSVVNFRLDMNGSYLGLIRFLYDLNYINKIIRLNDLNVSAAKDKDGKNSLRLNATLNSYRFNKSVK